MKALFLALAACTLIGTAADARNNKNHKKNCTCSKHSTNQAAVLDRSYDHAYSARWADVAQSPRPGDKVTMSQIDYDQFAGYRQTGGGTMYYTLPTYTMESDRVNSGYTRPSPYMGDNAPENDGVEKNAYRNINYTNDAVVLPANDGSNY